MLLQIFRSVFTLERLRPELTCHRLFRPGSEALTQPMESG
jgi:hypothetical protein